MAHFAGIVFHLRMQSDIILSFMFSEISLKLSTGPKRLFPIILLWAGAGCALPPIHVPVSVPEVSQRSLSQMGIASWYGPGFHGQPTASGQIYNQFDLTAAHRTLPLGSRVTVTNLENGKSIEVSINDRGPFVEGRIIDLSYAAAESLAMVDPGTTPVRIELIHDDPPRITRIRSYLDYTLQVGSFIDLGNALELREALFENYPWATPISVVLFQGKDSTYYRVQMGIFSDRSEAEEHGLKLAKDGVPAIIMENWEQHDNAEDPTFLHPF